MAVLTSIPSMPHERAPPTEINTGSQVRAMAFTPDGKYLVSGDKEAVRVWRLADNEQVGTVTAKDVRSIAVSKDGKFIAAGKSWGETTVWDMSQTLKEVFKHDDEGHTVTSVDFSPADSTRLVIASGSRAASIWSVKDNKVPVVGPLKHQYWVIAAKFSPKGDRVATATSLRDSVRVYDSQNGNLLANIQAKVTPYYNTGLLWSNGDTIFVLSKTANNPSNNSTNQFHNPTDQSNNTIKQINVSNKSVALEWPVSPDSNCACIVSSESVIIHSAGCAVTLYDLSTHTPLPLTPLAHDAHSIALSLNGQLLAIGGGDGKIAFKDIPRNNIRPRR